MNKGLDLINSRIRPFFSGISVLIAGGFLRSLFGKNDPTKDIDIYIPDQSTFTNLTDILSLKGFEDEWESENSLVMSNGELTFDIIKIPFSDPEALLKTFDFTCCCCCCVLDSNTLFFHEDFFKHISNKELHVNSYVAQSIEAFSQRVEIYEKKGYIPVDVDLAKVLIEDNAFKKSSGFFQNQALEIGF